MSRFSNDQIESYQHMDAKIRELWTNFLDEGFDGQAGAHAVSLVAVNILLNFYEADHVRTMLHQQVEVIEAGMGTGSAELQ